MEGIQPNSIQDGSLMSKTDIRQQYQDYNIGYDYAVAMLKKLGFTEFAADQFLFAEG